MEENNLTLEKSINFGKYLLFILNTIKDLLKEAMTTTCIGGKKKKAAWAQEDIKRKINKKWNYFKETKTLRDE